MATTATIATAAIITRFLFGMGSEWLYGKNLFAMFNSGYTDAARHSLRRSSYECLSSASLLWWGDDQGLTLSVQDAPFQLRPDEGGSRARGACGSAGRGSGWLGHHAPSSAGV